MATKFTDTPVTLASDTKLCAESSVPEKGYTTPADLIALFQTENLHFTFALGSSTPNATVTVASLTASGSATNMDAAIIPKGSGAILASVPDNLPSGGNKRGSYSVDLQRARSSAAAIVSATHGFIGSGNNNIVSGNYSSIVGGDGNSSTQTVSFIGGGQNNMITGTGVPNSHCVIAGGFGNTATTQGATIGGGYRNQANGPRSTIPGGMDALTRGIYGAYAYASGQFNTKGDAQFASYILRGSTTNDTQTELTADGTALSSNNIIRIPDNHVYKFTGKALARQASTGDVKSWDFLGCIKKGVGAGTTSIVGLVTITSNESDTGAAAWDVTIDADTTNGSLRVRVTGETSKTIRWMIYVETIELS